MPRAEISVQVTCHDRNEWSGTLRHEELSWGGLCTNRFRTPQEVLRDVADQLDRQCVNDIFAPPTHCEIES